MPGSPYPYARDGVRPESAGVDSDSSDQPLSRLSKKRSPSDRQHEDSDSDSSDQPSSKLSKTRSPTDHRRRLSVRSSIPHPPSSPSKEEKEKEKESQEEEEIPELRSIFPTIFVPCTIDYTNPLPPEPHDSSHRLASRLSQLEANSSIVKRNIAAIVLRESQRIQQTCRKKEAAILAATGQLPRSKHHHGPTLGDEAALIRRLEAHPHHGTDYNLGAGFSHTQIAYEGAGPDDTPREEGMKEMLNTFKFGMQNMKGYKDHLQGVREQRKIRFAREVAEELGRKAVQAGGAAPSQQGGVDRMDIG